MVKVTNTYFKKEPLVLIMTHPKRTLKYPQKSMTNLLYGESVLIPEEWVGPEIKHLKKKGYITIDPIIDEPTKRSVIVPDPVVADFDETALESPKEDSPEDLEKLEEELLNEVNSVPQGGRE